MSRKDKTPIQSQEYRSNADEFYDPGQRGQVPMEGPWLDRWEEYRQRLAQLASDNGGAATRDGLNIALHAPPGYGLCIQVLIHDHQAGFAGVLAGPLGHDAKWTLDDGNPNDDLWDTVEAIIAGRVTQTNTDQQDFEAEFQKGGGTNLWRPTPLNIEPWQALQLADPRDTGHP